MVNLLRRLLKLALLAGLGYAVYRLISEVQPADEPSITPADQALRATSRAGDTDTTERRGRAGTAPGGATRPASSPAQPARGTRSIGVGEVPADAQKWVEPDSEGECPASHPVKANLASGIFHVPGGRHYERTKADRCYRDAETAEADDLRQSKQ